MLFNKNFHFHNPIWGVIIIILLMGGCSKDENPSVPLNTAPTINGLTAEPNRLAYSETSNVTVTAVDQENDPLTYQWVCDYGGFQGSTTSNQAIWQAPNQVGTCRLDVTVNDGIETTTSGVDIEVMGLFFDDFSTNLSVWTTSYSDAWIASGIAHITGNRSGYYGTLYYASPIYIPPEYTLQGKVARVSSFSGDDFYALYAKVNDTGSITIKYWCFVIEPSKANENWALICFVASATSGDWALLAQDSFGESSLINTQPNEWNNLSWKVEEDKTVILQVNKRHLYQSDEITNIENSFGVTITMDLVRGGARTKYQKEILLDDAIVITPPSPLNQKSGVTRLEKDNQLFENDSEASLHSLDISKLKTLREVLNNMY